MKSLPRGASPDTLGSGIASARGWGIIDFNEAWGKAGDGAGVFGQAIRSTTSVGIGLYLVVAAGFGIPVSQFILR